MALADLIDVESHLGRAFTGDESTRASALLARAEAVVMGFLGCEAEPDPVPAGLTSTVAAITARAFASGAPVGAQSVSVDDGSVSYYPDAASGGIWLTKVDKMALRPFRCGGGLTSVQLVGERYKIEAS